MALDISAAVQEARREWNENFKIARKISSLEFYTLPNQQSHMRAKYTYYRTGKVSKNCPFVYMFSRVILFPVKKVSQERGRCKIQETGDTALEGEQGE